MIPKEIADEIEAAFPGVKLVEREVNWRKALGVELDGKRNACMFDETPENWQRAKAKLMAWLSVQSAKPTSVTATSTRRKRRTAI